MTTDPETTSPDEGDCVGVPGPHRGRTICWWPLACGVALVLVVLWAFVTAWEGIWGSHPIGWILLVLAAIGGVVLVVVGLLVTRVIYVGSSNFAGWSIAQANEAASARHFLGLVSEQSLYNLAERTIELEVLPACQAYGLGVLPWSPLAGGLLAGVLDGTSSGRRSSSGMQARVEAMRPRLEAWEQLCADLGESPATVGVAWLLHRPEVTAPIVGPRTMQQLDDAIRASTLVLTDEVLARLDEIFPGPGPAPEAYAW